MASVLEAWGYTVLRAGTAVEALRQAAAHVGAIRLVLSDVIMPEMNGRELANRLRAVQPNLKQLFMSGHTAGVIARRGMLEEGVHFMPKPFSGADLATKVREVLDGW